VTSYRLAEINKVLLSGRLTRDAELRFTPAGVAVATLPLAHNRRYRDDAGEWKEDTTYVTVTVFRRLAELAGERLRKGSAVLVEGRLHGRSWTGTDGRTHKVLEVWGDRVQFLDARSEPSDNVELGVEAEPDRAEEPELPF
jgi:single-strand DNA-binding protein